MKEGYNKGIVPLRMLRIMQKITVTGRDRPAGTSVNRKRGT